MFLADRHGRFGPVLIDICRPRFAGLDDKIIALYARSIDDTGDRGPRRLTPQPIARNRKLQLARVRQNGL